MDEKDKYFSDEYSPESVTNENIKDLKITDISYREVKHEIPYIQGKPFRTFIKAKITHD